MSDEPTQRMSVSGIDISGLVQDVSFNRDAPEGFVPDEDVTFNVSIDTVPVVHINGASYVTEPRDLRVLIPVWRLRWLRWIGIRVYTETVSKARLGDAAQMESGEWEATIYPLNGAVTSHTIQVFGRTVWRREVGRR